MRNLSALVALLLSGAAQSSATITITMSAASYKWDGFARSMIVTSFGYNLATSTATASRTPLPNTLAGTTLKLVDSRGRDGYAELFFVSPIQVNWLIPDWLADGPATVTITSGDGTASTGTVQIGAVAPGLFTANSSGEGVPAAAAVRVGGDGRQTSIAVAECGAVSGSCVPVHMDLDTPGDVVLLLFGTGIRGYRTISARLGGREAEVLGAQPQGDYVGLDQVNVRLARNLVGSGDLDVVLTVDGKPSNAVTIAVGPAPHQITSVTPQQAMVAQPVSSFAVTGRNLSGVTGVRFYPPGGITVSGIAGSATSVTAQLSISANAALGERRVCLTSPAGRSNCLPFRMTAGPVPAISNLKLSASLAADNSWYTLAGSLDFTDGDGDIERQRPCNTASPLGCAWLRVRGKYRCGIPQRDCSCGFIGTSDVFHKPGQSSGLIEFNFQYAPGLIHSFLPDYGYMTVEVTLIDAAGHESNITTADPIARPGIAIFACPW